MPPPVTTPRSVQDHSLDLHADTADAAAAAAAGVFDLRRKVPGSFCISRNPFDRLVSQYRFKAGLFPEMFAPTCGAFAVSPKP